MVVVALPDTPESGIVSRRDSAVQNGSSDFLLQARNDAFGKPTTESGDLNSNIIAKLGRSDVLLPSKDTTGDAFDLLNGFAEGSIVRPAKAVQQILGFGATPDGAPAATIENESNSHKTGKVVGSFVPFVGMVGITRGASIELLGECCSPSITRLITEQATAGFLTGSLLTPSDVQTGEDLISARMRQGSMTAAQLSTLTGVGATLDQQLPQASDPGTHFARRFTINFITKTVGSFVDAEGLTSFGASSEDTLSESLNTVALTPLKDSPATHISFDQLQSKSLFNLSSQTSQPAEQNADASIVDKGITSK